MKSSVEQMQEQLELYINEQAADLHVFRVSLQTMFLTMLSSHPHKGEMIGGLKDQVIAALKRTDHSTSNDVQGSQRRAQLEIARAEEFFQEVQVALGVPDDPAAGKTKN